jgi:hypothetical protein
MDDITYIEESELTKYIWNNYQHLFSRLEQLGVKAVLAEDKATSASSVAMTKLLRERWGAESEPEVMAALSNGTNAFQLRVRERVMRECGDRIFINRCPVCERILRTPRAKQCLWCGHSWHKSVL